MAFLSCESGCCSLVLLGPVSVGRSFLLQCWRGSYLGAAGARTARPFPECRATTAATLGPQYLWGHQGFFRLKQASLQSFFSVNNGKNLHLSFLSTWIKLREEFRGLSVDGWYQLVFLIFSSHSSSWQMMSLPFLPYSLYRLASGVKLGVMLELELA